MTEMSGNDLAANLYTIFHLLLPGGCMANKYGDSLDLDTESTILPFNITKWFTLSRLVIPSDI